MIRWFNFFAAINFVLVALFAILSDFMTEKSALVAVSMTTFFVWLIFLGVAISADDDDNRHKSAFLMFVVAFVWMTAYELVRFNPRFLDIFRFVW